MTTYCHYDECERPADFRVGIRAVLCAHHFKRENAEWADATPERQTEIRAEVARLQGGAA